MPHNILGIRVDDFSKEYALQRVNDFLDSNNQFLIFTPNPEMAVKARNDQYFRETLNSGQLNICDGIGFVVAAKLDGGKIQRITGVDFMVEICKLAEQKNCSIYFLGGRGEGTARAAANELLKKLPNLKIAGCERGPEVRENSKFLISNSKLNSGLVINEDENEKTISNINKVKPDILFVAFGMGKQEKWLRENLYKMPSVKIGMGVGGSFDFISGEVKRAPLLIRKIGLEWAYRLVREPRRLARIWNATIVFAWLVIIQNLKNKISK